MNKIGDGTKKSGYFTGLSIAQQFANAVCHFLREHPLARTHSGGGKELPLDDSTWRHVLEIEFRSDAITDAQSLRAYCRYYNEGSHGHGYDKDHVFDCGTGRRKGEQKVGLNLKASFKNETVHPGERGPFLKPKQVIDAVKQRLPSIPRGKHGAEQVLVTKRIEKASERLEAAGEFDPNDNEDARRKIESAIVRRYGSGRFRAELIAAYNGLCCVTRCNVSAALEAAHIKPYNGPKTNVVENGLLLRADIHTLFDLNFLGIDPERLTIELASSLQGTTYQRYHEKRLAMPKQKTHHPNIEALKWRWEVFIRGSH